MNHMKLNLTKTWLLEMRGKTQKTPPGPVHIIERKSELKLLGVTFHENPCNWDSNSHNMMHTLEELTILFHSIFMSVFT